MRSGPGRSPRQRGVAPLAAALRRLGSPTLAKAAVIAATAAALAGLGWLIWGALLTGGDGRKEPPVIGSSQQALDVVLGNVRRQGLLQPNQSPDVTVQEMLYGEAVDRAAELGVRLDIQPEGYVCPGGCPYPGEPADSRGWLILMPKLPGEIPDEATAYLYWIGEDGGGTISVIR